MAELRKQAKEQRGVGSSGHAQRPTRFQAEAGSLSVGPAVGGGGRRCLGGLPSAIASVPVPLDRKPGRSPGLKSARKVRRAGEAEILQRRGRQARLIALVADEDDATIEFAAERRVAMPGGRIDAPFEHIARADMSHGDPPVAPSLNVASDIDEHRSLTRRVKRLPWPYPVKPPAGGRDHVVDGRAAAIRQLGLLASSALISASGRCRHPSTERGSTNRIGPPIGRSRDRDNAIAPRGRSDTAAGKRGCRISPPRRLDRRFAAANRSRPSSRRAENASDQIAGGAELVASDLRDSLRRKQQSLRRRTAPAS